MGATRTHGSRVVVIFVVVCSVLMLLDGIFSATAPGSPLASHQPQSVPSAENAAPLPGESQFDTFIVQIAEDGRFFDFYMGSHLAGDALADTIERHVLRTTRENRLPALRIRAHPECPAAAIAELLASARDLGISQIYFTALLAE